MIAGVRWDRFEGYLLGQIAGRFGGQLCSEICLLMSLFGEEMKCGFPDLMLCKGGRKEIKEQDDKQLENDQENETIELKTEQQRQNEKQIEEEKIQAFDIMFVEVKGPRDHLSNVQKCWLNTLSSAGVRAIVCRVDEE
ncbi:MAG: hypothetical protein EZS28_004718 [Streblomastix strix]|uniref:Fanconi-associated nuclease n=1 Tax=Streblomastix strix TaxID=222440 RepID=A0A5J4WY56_9EUKA|nr:MAG: hypothetical protein EZS28_004718 [Streblomastix strix]